MQKIFTTDDIGAGVRFDAAPGDSVYVKQGVTVGSTDNAVAIEFDGIQLSAVIKGSVLGGLSGGDGDGYGGTVNVGATGEVAGMIALTMVGGQSLLENAGRIEGTLLGVQIGNTQGFGGVATIVNTGTITALDAVAHNTLGGPGDLILVNEGSIFGSNTSFSSGLHPFSGGSNTDVVINRGLMVGDIRLSTGNDIYRGAKGEFHGSVLGQDGNDRINCGDDDDRLYGGSGNDRLRGGSGEDTFYFDSSINGSLNVDKILDFSVADDMIGVSAAIFGLIDVADLDGRFVANKTGKAADANDAFIYQTTTGKLYFDVDGKGGEDARLFAVLDHNLKLTADNFEIV